MDETEGKNELYFFLLYLLFAKEKPTRANAIRMAEQEKSERNTKGTMKLLYQFHHRVSFIRSILRFLLLLFLEK